MKGPRNRAISLASFIQPREWARYLLHMYVEWGWEQRAVEARGRLLKAVTDGAAADVYRAVLERLVTSSSYGAVYRSILSRLPAADRSLLADALRARGS